MPTLREKIYILYPELETTDYGYINGEFIPNPFHDGTIVLRNDGDGNGDYIEEWNHPTLAQPTQAELDAVTE